MVRTSQDHVDMMFRLRKRSVKDFCIIVEVWDTTRLQRQHVKDIRSRLKIGDERKINRKIIRNARPDWTLRKLESILSPLTGISSEEQEIYFWGCYISEDYKDHTLEEINIVHLDEIVVARKRDE